MAACVYDIISSKMEREEFTTEQFDDFVCSILKGEQNPTLFTEMSTVSRDYVQNWSIGLNPDINRNRPTYFKLYNNTNYKKATKCARISFLEPKYIVHRGEKGLWKLANNKEKKLLMNFLSSHKRGIKGIDQPTSNWQYAIALWNVEMHFIDSPDEAFAITMKDYSPTDLNSPLPIDLPMPNYLNLR